MNPPLLFDWMRPLGWALMHFIWQGTLVALLLAGVLSLLRTARPQVRGRAAMAALLVMAACPVFTAWYYRDGRTLSMNGALEFERQAQPLPLYPQGAFAMEFEESDSDSGAPKDSRINPAVETAATSSVPAGASHEAGWTRQMTSLMPWGVWVWLGGVTLLALWRLGGWMQIGRWMRHGVNPAPLRWTAVLHKLVRESGLRRPVRLMASLKVAVPVTAGWLRPVILFPVSLLSGLPPRHVEALLAHELAHIRRMDYLVNLAQTALETLLFYHPAVWWTGRIIRQEREHCCDDAAVALHGDVQEYARALACLADMPSPVLIPAAKGGSLLLRLRRLLTPQSASGPALRIPASVAAAGAALSLALLFVNPPAGVAGVKSPATPESQTASAEAKAFGEISDKNDGTVDSNRPDESVPAAPVPAVAANPVRGRILDRNRVVLANNDASGHRKYPWGALAAHALGYVTDAGKAGVEANFEKVLAAGKDVSLTLDVRIQMITQRCLEEAGVGRGAVVVLDPQDAGILAMASFPDFDPGIFSGGVDSEEIKCLAADQTRPMVNRAVLPDSPGSVYKIVTAVALCRAGKGSLNFACPGFIDYGRPLACWIYAQQHGSHGGPLPMTAALKCSCNCWF
ncbi:MAG TPA: M56 family metallopeptidase, partial [Verrucomicrobiales bacterium]|nr:M56 family metallopeptidase [Verrucomicrobiales bacterium]